MHTGKIAGLLLASILILATIPTLYASAAQQEQTKAEKFIEIAEQAKEHADKLINKAKEGGVDVTAANNLMGEGTKLLNDAKDAFSKNDFQTAFSKARQAQEKFRDALRSLKTPAHEAAQERGRGILVAVDNAYERIQRLRDVIAKIPVSPENEKPLSWAKLNLTQAENSLTDARNAIQKYEFNVDVAAKKLAEANKYISQAYAALKHIGNRSLWRAESFLKGIEKHVEKVKERVNQLAEKGFNIQELQTKLTRVDELIQKARASALAGDKKATLAFIKEIDHLLHEITKETVKLHKGK